MQQHNACPPGRHETRETPAARKGNLITTTPRTGYTHTIYMSNRCRVTGEVTGAYSRAVRRGAAQHWPFGMGPGPTWTCAGTCAGRGVRPRTWERPPRRWRVHLWALVCTAVRHERTDYYTTHSIAPHNDPRGLTNVTPIARRVITVHNTGNGQRNHIRRRPDRDTRRTGPPRVTADTRETFE